MTRVELTDEERYPTKDDEPEYVADKVAATTRLFHSHVLHLSRIRLIHTAEEEKDFRVMFVGTSLTCHVRCWVTISS